MKLKCLFNKGKKGASEHSHPMSLVLPSLQAYALLLLVVSNLSCMKWDRVICLHGRDTGGERGCGVQRRSRWDHLTPSHNKC